MFLLNTPASVDDVWDTLPRSMQQQMLDKKVRLFVIDAYRVARENGMGSRINTIMQTCFFAISGVLPGEEAIGKIKRAVEKTYGRKGRKIVELNFAAIDATLADLHQVELPEQATSDSRYARPCQSMPRIRQEQSQARLSPIGVIITVSLLPDDGTYPLGDSGLGKTQYCAWKSRYGMKSSVYFAVNALCLPAFGDS